MSQSKHTPTPWKVTDHGHATTVRADNEVFPKPVAELWDNGDSREANAAFIVRAVNSHDALVSALQEMTDHYCDTVNSGDCGFWNPEEEERVKRARAALALVEHFQADARR